MLYLLLLMQNLRIYKLVLIIWDLKKFAHFNKIVDHFNTDIKKGNDFVQNYQCI